MITVVLRGGLGNQMFQYATGLALARKHKTGLVLDTVYLNDRFPRKEFTFRVYDLDVFTVAPRFTLLSRIAEKLPIPGFWLAIDLALMKCKDILGVSKLIKEKKELVFEHGVAEAGGNVTLWGHWQTEKYFEDARDDVRSAFTFRDALAGEAQEIAKDIASADSVSLHVRRGDYVAFKSNAATIGNTGTSFYQDASAYIAARVKAPHFFVFSDDIEWCRENIKLSFPTTFVSASSSGRKAGFHLRLMSLCKHNIVTNSSFSWWGAWLNGNKEKIVIAPKQWMKSVPAETADIIPKGWVTI